MTLSVRYLWTGDAAEGERWFGRMRAVARSVLDEVAREAVPGDRLVHTDPIDPTPAHESCDAADRLPDEAATDALLDAAGPGLGVAADPGGGPAARRRVRARRAAPDAFSHRSAAYSMLAVGIAGVRGCRSTGGA